jgi:hypothetical protein
MMGNPLPCPIQISMAAVHPGIAPEEIAARFRAQQMPMRILKLTRKFSGAAPGVRDGGVHRLQGLAGGGYTMKSVRRDFLAADGSSEPVRETQCPWNIPAANLPTLLCISCENVTAG